MAAFGIGPKTLDCQKVRALAHENLPLMSHSKRALADFGPTGEGPDSAAPRLGLPNLTREGHQVGDDADQAADQSDSEHDLDKHRPVE